MHNDRFYRSSEKYDVERSLERHKDYLTDEDQEIINRYLKDKVRIDHISQPRYRKLGFTLIMLKEFIPKPFTEATIEDYLDAIQALKDGKKQGKDGKSKPYSKNTVYDASVILKGFLKWLHKKKLTSIDIQDISDQVKAPKRKDLTDQIKPDDLLIEDDIISMAAYANSQRDRTLILVTYESGARIGEIGRLTWKDINFNRIANEDESKIINTAKIYIDDTKEGKKRYGLLTLSAPDLLLLKNQIKPKDDDFIFTEAGDKPMSYIAMYRVFERTAKKAGITKPVRPHLFRHARATAMIRENIQESIIKQTLWNNLDTKMFKVYMSLGEKDIDNEMLKHMGIKEIRDVHEKKAENMPHTCGKCHTINPVGAAYCNGCGRPISKNAINEVADADKDAEESEEYKQLLKDLDAIKAKYLLTHK